jgi:hypothetical protein
MKLAFKTLLFKKSGNTETTKKPYFKGIFALA